MAEWTFNQAFIEDLVKGNCQGVIKKGYLYFNTIKIVPVDAGMQIQLLNKKKLLCSIDAPLYQHGDELAINISPDSRMKTKIQ